MIRGEQSSQAWQTKPTDRFVLKWIKCHLSARVTPRLVGIKWLRPWMVTLSSSGLGMVAGLVFALGLGWLAGLFAVASQVLDGVDGQYARITGRVGPAGALIDSVMDRYADNALMIGLIIYLIRISIPVPTWLILFFGFLALVGSNMVSYSTARAEPLGIAPFEPTLASKGTRTTVIAVCALGSLFWHPMPILALGYLVIHPNVVVILRLIQAFGSASNLPQDEE